MGDSVQSDLNIDALARRRITNLEDSYDFKELWEDITGNTTGTITVYQKQPPNEAEIIKINEDKWYNGEDALVVQIEDSRPVDQALKDANGSVILADIDASGNYVLHIGYDEFDDPIPPVLPISGDYALIWLVEGFAKDTFIIPPEVIIDKYNVDSPLQRDFALKEFAPIFDGDNLNMKSGGYKDFFVSTAVKLGDALNTVFETVSQTILGALNEVYYLTQYDQVVKVKKNAKNRNGQYNDWQLAMDSILDASDTKRYAIIVYGGNYGDPNPANPTVVTGKDHVQTLGVSARTVRMINTRFIGGGVNGGLKEMAFDYTHVFPTTVTVLDFTAGAGIATSAVNIEKISVRAISATSASYIHAVDVDVNLYLLEGCGFTYIDVPGGAKTDHSIVKIKGTDASGGRSRELQITNVLFFQSNQSAGNLFGFDISGSKNSTTTAMAFEGEMINPVWDDKVCGFYFSGSGIYTIGNSEGKLTGAGLGQGSAICHDYGQSEVQTLVFDSPFVAGNIINGVIAKLIAIPEVPFNTDNATTLSDLASVILASSSNFLSAVSDGIDTITVTTKLLSKSSLLSKFIVDGGATQPLATMTRLDTGNVVVNNSVMYTQGFGVNCYGEVVSSGDNMDLSFCTVLEGNVECGFGLINKVFRADSIFFVSVGLVDENTNIGNPRNRTFQDMFNINFNAGWVSGQDIIENLDYTINVTSGSGYIRIANNEQAPLKSFDIVAFNNLALVDNAENYIYVDYNSGSPIVAITQDSASILENENDKYELYEVFKEVIFDDDLQTITTELHITNHKHKVTNIGSRSQEREYSINRIKRADAEGGLIIGESADTNRYVTMTGGKVWLKDNKILISAFDSSGVDTFDRYFRVAGTFYKTTGRTQWDNAQYNDITVGVITMTNNRYSFQDFYIDADSELLAVYATAQYVSLASAEIAPRPTPPDRVADHSLYIGRIVFQKGDTIAQSVLTAFGDIPLTSTPVTAHSQLSDLGFSSSGHTGTPNKIAGFDALGIATYYDNTFLQNEDTPSSYTGQAFKLAQVSGSETGLEFTDSPIVQSITIGTLTTGRLYRSGNDMVRQSLNATGSLVDKLGDTVGDGSWKVTDDDDVTLIETNSLGNTSVYGNLNIYGDIVQSGSAYETHAEQVYTTNDLIITRDGAIAGLGVGEFTGFQATLYDGVNDGQLVFDKDGIARVGDVGDLVALAGREDTPTNNGVAVWNDSLFIFETDSNLIWDGSSLFVGGGFSLQDTTNVEASINAGDEEYDATLFFGTPFGGVLTNAKKAAIIAEGIDSWGRSILHICLDNTDDSNEPIYSAKISDSVMSYNHDGSVKISGTKTPDVRLEVEHLGEAIRVSGGAEQSWMSFFNGANRQGYVGSYIGGDDLVLNSDFDLYLSASNSPEMVLYATGGVEVINGLDVGDDLDVGGYIVGDRINLGKVDGGDDVYKIDVERSSTIIARINGGSAGLPRVSSALLLSTDSTRANGVFSESREVPTASYNIDTVNQGTKTFTISDDGDLSLIFIDGRVISISGSTGNDGNYTIVSSNYSAPDFNVVVSEAIPSAVADGTMNVIGATWFYGSGYLRSDFQIGYYAENMTDDGERASNQENAYFSVQLNGDVYLPRDGQKLYLGEGQDAYLSHDGSDLYLDNSIGSTIIDAGTDLQVKNIVEFQSSDGTKGFRFYPNLVDDNIFQIGESSSDTDANLVIARMNTTGTNLKSFSMFADESVFSGDVVTEGDAVVVGDTYLEGDVIIEGNRKDEKSVFYDEFWALDLGTIGVTPWIGSTLGTIDISTTESNGVLELTTRAVLNDTSIVGSSTTHYVRTKRPDFEAYIKLDSLTNASHLIGFQTSTFVLYIRYDSSSSANWELLASSSTPHVGSVATTNWTKVGWNFITDTSIEWFIDDVLQGVVSSGIPAGLMSRIIRAKTLDTDAKTFSVDYYKVWQDRV